MLLRFQAGSADGVPPGLLHLSHLVGWTAEKYTTAQLDAIADLAADPSGQGLDRRSRRLGRLRDPRRGAPPPQPHPGRLDPPTGSGLISPDVTA